MEFNTLPILLATTFLSTSAIAQTVPEINADYLTSLTGDNISWEDVSTGGENTVEINGKYYKYTYTTPNGYDTITESENISVVDPADYWTYKYVGAAINNASGNDYGDIDKKVFLNNKVTANLENNTNDYMDLDVHGGAISNQGEIGNIIADFVGNSVETAVSGSYSNKADAYAYGGAIYNDGSIGDITGDFIGNYTTSTTYYANGGAIYNKGTIGDIIGDFIGNSSAFGSAISNYGTIGNITGDFIGNYASRSDSTDGVIANGGTIGDITGDFIGNYAKSEYSASGGVISNGVTIGDITGNFIGNYASGIKYAEGGAIYNDGAIGDITGDFIGNYANVGGQGKGGAIHNFGTIGNISGNFINNYAKTSSDTGTALGGAIYTYSELTFKANGITSRFSGNYTEDSRGKINNAIWVDNSSTSSHPTLTFNMINGGTFVFDDEIDGGYTKKLYDDNGNFIGYEIIRNNYGYNLNITGDVCESCFANSITFNDRINNVHDLTLDTTQMVLGKNAYVEVTNNYIARNNPLLRVEVDLADNKAGQLFVDGNIYGKTRVIVDTKNYKDVRGEESIVFVQSNGDIYLDGENGAKAETEEEKAQAFSVLRVVGSPYMWNVEYEDGGVEKIWSLAMNDTENTYTEDCDETPEEPEPVIPNEPIQPLGPIQVAPEIIGFEALQSAGLSQTNGMVYNIMRKVGISKLYCKGCGFYDYNWDGEPFHNAWVDTTYNGLTIESPVEIEAKVWGIEAGSDLQHDLNNKLGIFVSYRQGNYEMDGKGEKYYSTIGSEIDIDSYLAGLYYRYDNNNWYAFATVYGGMQNAEIKTDDGITTDTDGIEFGGSIEAGYNYALTRKLSVTPSLGAFYSQISYDDATDNVGKTVEYNDLKQVELEAGAKFAYTQYTDNGFYSLYVKPSVVQTLIDGDEIDVTELGKVDTVEDQTLGRVEIGGNYGFNDNWSAYGWANYTFGSSYEATSLGAGVNYSW